MTMCCRPGPFLMEVNGKAPEGGSSKSTQTSLELRLSLTLQLKLRDVV